MGGDAAVSSPCLILAAGGTGGHVYPALAVADALRRHAPAARIQFIGGRRGIERDIVPAAGYALHRLPAAGMRGLGVLGALRFAVSFAIASVASLFVLFRQRPDLVLATGGYASAAPAMAAALMGRPLWLQEQNSVPGSTNRTLARFAERAYVAYAEASPALARAGEIRQLGNPLRGSLSAAPATHEDYAHFGLSEGRPTLLLFGGSRGARSLNAALRDAAPRLAQSEWQLLAQSGREEFESTRQVVEAAAPGRFHVHAFLHEMERAYRVADLVICRAGALTLAELEVVGKPAVLVPFPHATDDHQTRNARAFAAGGAAQVVADADFDANRLLAPLGSPGLIASMQEAARRASGKEAAADRLALDILERVGARP